MDGHTASRVVAGVLISYFDIYREETIFNGNIYITFLWFGHISVQRKLNDTSLFLCPFPTHKHTLTNDVFQNIISFFPEILHLLTTSKRA